VILALAYSGLRWGELAALRVRDVDLLRGRLSVRRAVTEVNGRLVWTTPKDKEARSVPVPSFLRDELARAIEHRGPDDLLFPAPQGGVLRVRSARRAWFNNAVTEAGLGGLTPHMLRHTAASLAVSAGANVLAVQRMLGHQKASMTLDVYSDLFDGDLDEVAGRLDSARPRSCGLSAD
jgi:integrase